MSRQMLPYWSTFGWKHEGVNVTCGGSNGYEVGNLSASLKVRPSYTVPAPPVIVPVHWKMLSPSGKAEMPASPPIINDMSSDCKRLLTEFGRAELDSRLAFEARSAAGNDSDWPGESIESDDIAGHERVGGSRCKGAVRRAVSPTVHKLQPPSSAADRRGKRSALVGRAIRAEMEERGALWLALAISGGEGECRREGQSIGVWQ
mmetsp:Transcript_39131/g.91554  ORF Transcript_39131/g.91554 Transcript_39131/m.91554 type:complete len:204 (+) Transcript_39131:418-1029(+)